MYTSALVVRKVEGAGEIEHIFLLQSGRIESGKELMV